MNKVKKEITIFTIICLVVSTPLWYMAYKNPEADIAIFFTIAAGFFPMILTLVITKITKEGWGNLGIVFNLKKGWKIYLIAIFGTTLLPYISDLLLLLIFQKHVSVDIASNAPLLILGAMLMGIACFIECLGEELGWIGYLFPRLEKVFGTIMACVLLGIIRAVWHLGIFAFIEFPIHSFFELMLSNIFLQFFMVYMYKKSGSLFPCSISHGISNLLPYFLVYESAWYYKSILPIIVCMMPSMLYGAFGYFQMKKSGLIEKRV